MGFIIWKEFSIQKKKKQLHSGFSHVKLIQSRYPIFHQIKLLYSVLSILVIFKSALKLVSSEQLQRFFFFYDFFFNLAFHTSNVFFNLSLPKESFSWIDLILKVLQSFQSALRVKLWLSVHSLTVEFVPKCLLLKAKTAWVFLYFGKCADCHSKFFIQIC